MYRCRLDCRGASMMRNLRPLRVMRLREGERSEAGGGQVRGVRRRELERKGQPGF
jgi:hypothetical protein